MGIDRDKFAQLIRASGKSQADLSRHLGIAESAVSNMLAERQRAEGRRAAQNCAVPFL
jgi:predicted transcriptional regulator